MKGNPILGTGSGSIGDVTIMRRNGSQVTRVRLRKIKNPMSQGQAEQRMYMAPILKFYSPLAKVLETSFEGLNRADSYAKFLSVNSNLARSYQWAVKKGSGFTPLPYQVSAGTLPSPIVVNENDVPSLQVSGVTTETATIGALSTALISEYDLQNGDQVTVIAAVSDGDNFIKKAFRFFIDETSEERISDYGLTIQANDVLSVEGNLVGLAFIFSRWENNAWRRSNSFMVCSPNHIEKYTGDENLAAAIASYMKSAGKTPVSDVYLNGSDE